MTSQSDRPHLVLIPGLLYVADLFAAQAALSTRPHRAATARASKAPARPRHPRRGAAQLRARRLSMGGHIAFEILRQASARVRRLALLDTNARADWPEQSEQRRQLIALARRAWARRRAGEAHAAPPIAGPSGRRRPRDAAHGDGGGDGACSLRAAGDRDHGPAGLPADARRDRLPHPRRGRAEDTITPTRWPRRWRKA